MSGLAEQLEFAENPLFEKLIADILRDGYSILDDFFPISTIDGLRSDLLFKYEDDLFKKAAIGNRINEVIKTEVRGDFILWMDEKSVNKTQESFFSRINDLSNYLNKTCFLGILKKEFHYAVYPEGKFYKRHLDTFQNDDCRRLSVVCYLNENDWLPEHGGELVLYLKDEKGLEFEKTVFPLPARAVIFESQKIEHEVKPAKRERLSITGWLKTR
ncbi:2OG-Fe(II) oxygenase [Maribacter sp. PR1]|uniref:2OG-Fe(II) oxygenase n=1 Tax=Maribacter cobaltidurans TaxID=1178778 RepID=A0ABU7IQX8_9FLAO|nr:MULTISPECIES: 2OG-Fe(II) oxygenase [Maribacter]MDC6387962.1 2OG-Fe(II) oxygenase [Maribacter sp. PR1]MEE1975351.1 2OG-Fe(II) oxygenase [Maribacter cobaltidurans]